MKDKCTHVECSHVSEWAGHCLGEKCPNSIFRCPVHRKDLE